MTAPARRHARTLGAILAASALALGGVLVAPLAAQAATLTVTSDLDDSSGGTLREVIATANSGDTILFDPSVTTIALAGSIPLPKGITIDGGGTVTITRGALGAFAQLGIQPDAPDQDYTFTNITIAGVPGGQGAAVYASDGGAPVNAPRDITLSSVTVRDQTSPFGPAFGALQVGGDILITDSVIENNTATTGDGGAVSLDSVQGGITITDTVFRGNSATAGNGGALAVLDGPDVVIQDSEFLNNSSSGDGGAIHVADTINSVSIERTTFQSNEAQGYGGGIHMDQVDLDSSLGVHSSTFSADSTGEFGAALAIGTVIGEVTVINSTLDEQGTDDFAMMADLVSGELSIVYSTVIGGIYVKSNPGITEVASTIIFEAGGVTILVDDFNPAGVLYSVLSSPLTFAMTDLGNNQFGVFPKLGPLQDNGGPTFTRMPLAGSPAIDQGQPGGSPPTWDQRFTGFPRVIGGRVDVGAVETSGVAATADSDGATLAATGQTPNRGIPIIGGVLLLGGAAAVVITMLRRRLRHPSRVAPRVE